MLEAAGPAVVVRCAELGRRRAAELAPREHLRQRPVVLVDGDQRMPEAADRELVGLADLGEHRPAGVDEVVTTFPSRLGARERLTSTEPARTVTVVGIAHARSTPHGAELIFLTDSEAARLAGHPGRVDAIGILRGPGFELGRVRGESSEMRLDSCPIAAGDRAGELESIVDRSAHQRHERFGRRVGELEQS